MSEYILEDGNGNYIKQNEFTKKYSTTSSIDIATRYPTYAKAKGVLKGSLPGKMKRTFHVKELVQKSCENDKNDPDIQFGAHIDAVKKLGSEELGESSAEYISNTLKSFAEFIDRKRDVLNSLSDEHGKVEREIIDIEHYIEFNDLNAYQGWLAFKLLQQRLRKRRMIKNDISAIGYMEVGGVNTGELRNAASRIDGLENRRYSPRELTELFD